MYFDYASTSLKRKEVLKNLINNIDIFEGNPSSIHYLGRNSNKYLEEARLTISKSINADKNDIIFTSGASESNSIVISNFNNLEYNIISTKIEHKSILESLEKSNSEIILIDSKQNGKISIDDIVSKINKNTKLVSVMMVNNETGIIQPVKEIGEYLSDKRIWFHVDAVQALGHIDIDVNEIKCDSMSLSGHKIGGLNGFGILYCKKKLESLIHGGNQERGRRAGTSNLLGAISMSESIKIINDEREYIYELKRYFIEKMQGIEFEINGDIEYSTNHIVNMYFPFIKSDLLLTLLDMKKICVSAGSACNAGSLEPSYVIENMYDKERAKHSIRFSFGFSNTKQEIDVLTNVLHEIYENRKRQK